MRLCFPQQLQGVAGPAAFQRRLVSGLKARGHEACFGLSEGPYQAILVIGGTRQLAALRRAARQGIPVVQRLDGINWMHRRLWTGVRHFLRAELNNLLLRLIRDRLADHVIYQSRFAQSWWEREFGPARRTSSVVHNGVPLDQFSPEGGGAPPSERTRILMVEGNFAGGYQIGLGHAIALAQALQERDGRPVELAVAGSAPAGVRRGWTDRSAFQPTWLGVVDPGQIPALDRSAHMLFAGDLNPACPNSVIEALACGLPVVSFDTGALPELVQGQAGRLVGYGGDPWSLEPADIGALSEAALQVLSDQARFRAGARERAEHGLSLGRMVEGYLQALGW